MTAPPTAAHGQLLLVEDDVIFASVLARALRARGFAVTVAHDAAGALQQAKSNGLRFAVVDLKLGADSGLALIPALLREVPVLRIVLLTGYASIATAVEAIKRGAHDYLAKPIDADAVMRALLADAANAPERPLPELPLPLRRIEWEHIQRTLHECHDNISEAARRLGMHRRTLQRKLAKHPTREHDD